MLVRRTVAVLALAALGALTACDDGPPGASVGNPSANSSATKGERPRVPDLTSRSATPTRPRRAYRRPSRDPCLRSDRNYAQPGRRTSTSRRRRQLHRGEHGVAVDAQHSADQVHPPQFAALAARHRAGHPRHRRQRRELFVTWSGAAASSGEGPRRVPLPRRHKDAGKEKDLLVEKIQKDVAG